MTADAKPARRKPPSAKGRKTIGGGNPLDDDDPTAPVSPLAGAEWTPNGGREVAKEVEFQPAGPPAVKLPSLSDVDHTTPELHEVERRHLAESEAALDRLRTAFWQAGEALAVIRAARLYRETHATFEEYVEERWGMRRAHADRLVREYPLGKALDPIGSNEGQVRELLPVEDRHGRDAAVTVYKTIAETDGVRVTAAVIKGAVRVLPKGWDEGAAVERIRAYLAGKVRPETPPEDPWERVERFRAGLRRFKPETLQGVDATARKELAGELRALADQMEKDA